MAHAQSLVEAQPNVDKLVEDHLAVQSLIRAYQVSRVVNLLWNTVSPGPLWVCIVLLLFRVQLFPLCFDLSEAKSSTRKQKQDA